MPQPLVVIVYYSMYGHVRQLAEVMKDALEANEVTVRIVRAPETLPAGVLEKMHAPAKADDPEATTDDLEEADGIIFGIPTRYGMAASQMKAFWDTTGGLWQKQALAGKPAGIFFSTGTQNGGQETTALTWITQLTHHGMMYVPLGYASPLAFDMEVHGGGPYGAGTIAGPDGSRQPSEIEKGMATKQGETFAKVVRKLVAGAQAISSQVPKEAPKISLPEVEVQPNEKKTDGMNSTPVVVEASVAAREEKKSPSPSGSQGCCSIA